MMKTISVKRTASKGVVMGKAYVVKRPDLSADRSMINDSAVAAEVARYEAAVEAAKADLAELAETNAIFGAHLELVQDPTLCDGVIDKIKGELKNAELSLEETVDMFAAIFESMDDEYMRERGADMKDVGKRLMCKLKGVEDNALSAIHEKVIVVAKDLAPSDTAVMNLEYVLGFITQEGGVTSHVSIMARNLNLPALVGVEGILDEVNTGDMIAMDAKVGTIILNPDEAAVAEYTEKMEIFAKRERELAEIALLPAETIDGKTVELFANVGSIEDILYAGVFPHRCHGNNALMAVGHAHGIEFAAIHIHDHDTRLFCGIGNAAQGMIGLPLGHIDLINGSTGAQRLSHRISSFDQAIGNSLVFSILLFHALLLYRELLCAACAHNRAFFISVYHNHNTI